MDELLEDLREIFEGPSWDAVERRARVLYSYAKVQKEGVIVELGTYLGFGAFSLAYGAMDGNKLRVYTVDDYIERTGWAGEVYKPEYQDKFYSNWRKLRYYKQLDLHHVALSAEEASKTMRGVGLLFVDISPSIDIVPLWQDAVMQGGYILFRDTLTRSLGYDKQVKAAVATGLWKEAVEPDPYFMLIEKK